MFVRHNGGSVWLDLPPGRPWTKHACMYPSSGPRDPESIFAGHLKHSIESLAAPVGYGSLISTMVHKDSRLTHITVRFADGRTQLFGAYGWHNDLLGALVEVRLHFGRYYLDTLDGWTEFIFLNPRQIEKPKEG